MTPRERETCRCVCGLTPNPKCPCNDLCLCVCFGDEPVTSPVKGEVDLAEKRKVCFE
jgi:hypothetical protein